MDRKQRVKINSSYFGWNKVTSGVPQGSILGPTLFLMYINDIEENLDSTVLKFADDTKVIKVIDNLIIIIAMQTFKMISKDWKNGSNYGKCSSMWTNAR